LMILSEKWISTRVEEALPKGEISRTPENVTVFHYVLPVTTKAMVSNRNTFETG